MTCDDVSRIRRMDVEAGELMTIEAVQVGESGVVFVLPSGESSSLPPEAIEVVRDCGRCELSVS